MFLAPNDTSNALEVRHPGAGEPGTTGGAKPPAIPRRLQATKLGAPTPRDERPASREDRETRDLRAGFASAGGCRPTCLDLLDQGSGGEDELLPDRQPLALVLTDDCGFAFAIRAEDAVEQDQ